MREVWSLALEKELPFQGAQGCLGAKRKKPPSQGRAMNDGITRRCLGKLMCYFLKSEEKESQENTLCQLLNCFMGDFPRKIFGFSF